jgi:hypothetical protein
MPNLTQKQYYYDNGGIVYVTGGIGMRQRWRTEQKKTTRSSPSWLTLPELPIRLNQEDAQADLDAYAMAKGWELAS